MEYTDRNRAKLSKVKNVGELNRILDADPTLVDGLMEYARKQGVGKDHTPEEKERQLLLAQIRAYIGRNSTFDYSGYYSNIYTIDSTMLKAMEVLEN
jgi:carboxyl-terminal processing protease